MQVCLKIHGRIKRGWGGGEGAGGPPFSLPENHNLLYIALELLVQPPREPIGPFTLGPIVSRRSFI